MEQDRTKTRKGPKHDKTGCLTCRYRRKKCSQNTFPRCGTCIRLNLECVRDPVRRVIPQCSSVQLERIQGQPDTMSLALNTQLSPLPLDLSSPRRRQAMNHYIKVLSELLTISRDNNSFLSDFLPLAMESPALAEALIAYSSGHLSSTDPSYTGVSLTARSKALSELSMTVCRPAQSTAVLETTLSACLVLVTSEVSLGSHQSWYNHMIGAKHLISCAQSQNEPAKPTVHGAQALMMTSEGRWILRNFAYHDIIGSVTMGTQPLLGPDYLENITNEFDTYLGVASQLLVFIAETNYLGLTSTNIMAGSHLCRNYLGIEHRLKTWQCPVHTHPTLEAIAYAYRGAALIYLYRKVRQELETDNSSWLTYNMSLNILEENIQEVVSTSLDHIRDIPENDISESSLLFPLFLIGGEALGQDQMEVIRRRLEGSYRKRRFHNIQQALELLEDLWVSRQVYNILGGKRPDWEDILKSSNKQLLLT